MNKVILLNATLGSVFEVEVLVNYLSSGLPIYWLQLYQINIRLVGF